MFYDVVEPSGWILKFPCGSLPQGTYSSSPLLNLFRNDHNVMIIFKIVTKVNQLQFSKIFPILKNKLNFFVSN